MEIIRLAKALASAQSRKAGDMERAKLTASPMQPIVKRVKDAENRLADYLKECG
jgi:hypothetical protein